MNNAKSENSAYSGTSKANSTKKKKNTVYLQSRFQIKECIYKGLYHNTYKGRSIENNETLGFDTEEKTDLVIKMVLENPIKFIVKSISRTHLTRGEDPELLMPK
jgi:phosphopantetheinyl transferase (holo-ACP synthase)